MPTKRKQNCSVPKCTHEARVRGLCRTHYNYVSSRIVAAGKKTWKQLEDEGKVGRSNYRQYQGGLKGHFGV
jgi:hypothetical protein